MLVGCLDRALAWQARIREADTLCLKNCLPPRHSSTDALCLASCQPASARLAAARLPWAVATLPPPPPRRQLRTVSAQA